jgi:hypothetical protein
MAFDPYLIRELGRVYVQAAVDALFKEAEHRAELAGLRPTVEVIERFVAEITAEVAAEETTLGGTNRRA